MKAPDPFDHSWWLASRSAGIVALVAMTEEFANRWLSDGRSLGDREIDQLTDLWVHAVYTEPSAEPGSAA